MPPGADGSVTWNLEVVGGEVMFVCGGSYERDLPPLPASSYAFVPEGEYVRARTTELPEGPRRRNKLKEKELLGKDGWYLTADYSTEPPGVVLAAKPTAASRWRFLRTRAVTGETYYHIRNVNDAGKEAWLCVQEGKEKRYVEGDVRKPILCSDEMALLTIGTVSEGSK